MIVELDPISVLDLADGSVVIYTPAEGAAVVAVVSISGVAVDGLGVIGFASEAHPQVFGQSSGAFVQVIYNPEITDELRAGLCFGALLAEPWAPNFSYGATPAGVTPLADLVLAEGHYWQITPQPTVPVVSDPTPPDFASGIGGTVTEAGSGIVWEDEGALPTVGSLTVGVEVEGITGAAAAGDAYADVDELARLLKIRSPSAEQTAAMQRALTAAAIEIDAELGRVDALTVPFPALVVQVNLDRAEELWQQQEATLGFVGIGAESGPARIASNTWEKHAQKLAPLRQTWGIA